MLNRVTALVATAALVWASSAEAQEFKPFNNVTNVCPSCTTFGLDKITLKDGQEIAALIVAENPAFYVLRKFGEFRAVGKDKVEKVEQSPDATREPGHEDQILTKSGLVVSGKIVREREDTGMLEIQIAPGKVTMFVYKPVIEMMFKAGNKVIPAS